MDITSAYNLYHLSGLERCEIIAIEKGVFNIKIFGPKIGAAFLRSGKGEPPMQLVERAYPLRVAKRIGFKPSEIEFIE